MKDNIYMVHLGKLKWPFNEFSVAMVTRKMCLVGKLLPKGIFTFLAQSQHLECFPNKFPNNFLSIGIYRKFDF